jgi:phosphohistidine phosphatase
MSKTNEGLKLYVLRHGEAGAHIDDSAKDAVRPLTVAGRKEIGEIANSLKRLDVSFDLIASSPLKRALETAKIVADKLRETKSLEQWDELRATSDPNALYARLSALKGAMRILLVGHDPHLSGITGEIISGKSNVHLVLKKGGMAKINVQELRPKVSGELVWLLTPKLMKKMSR